MNNINRGLERGRLISEAMHVSTQEEADTLFQKLLALHPDWNEEEDGNLAESIRKSIGYHAGYYLNDTRERVERLFQCEHPYFGAIAEKGPPTNEEAFRIGVELGASRGSK